MTRSHTRLILASSSPRRQELLRHAGVEFEIAAPDVDERVLRGESAREMVRRLARTKALAIAERIEPASRDELCLVLAADTTVVAPGRRASILGKPTGAASAKRMLRALSGATHQVLTGYALVSVRTARVTRGSRARQPQIEVSALRVVSTRVTFRPLSSPDIERYVASGEPLDKAGAYGAQNIGMGLIAAIDGSYTNVVGLPLAEVLADLRRAQGARSRAR